MNPQMRYVIESVLNPEDFSSLTLRITIYDRSLKPAVLHFVASENLQIQQITLADSYIDYQIGSAPDYCAPRLEQMLRKATMIQ